MRIPAGFLALIVAAVPAGQAAASTEQPCGALLCLAGAMDGGGGGQSCAGYMAKYFSIIDWRHGHMDLVATAKDRMAFLSQCPSGDPALSKAVNDKYGSMQDGP
jgi:TrbM